MRLKRLSMSQLEILLNYLQIDTKDVLPKIAFAPSSDERHQWIENFKMKLIPEKDKITLEIYGTYIQQWAASYKERGLWNPSKPIKKGFKYKKIIN